MRIYSPAFIASLAAAQDAGIAPVWFAWFQARDRDTGDPVTMGLWSGDEDITVSVETPEGGTASRSYIGGCNLSIEGLTYAGDLTDNPVTVGLSQIADAAQQLVRGYDVRLAYCEIHATTWTRGVLTGQPQLMWVGIVDEGPISTPAAGGEGGIALTVRDEIVTQLQATNPARSSDVHQRRRSALDRFCEYAGIIGARNIQWYKG